MTKIHSTRLAFFCCADVQCAVEHHHGSAAGKERRHRITTVPRWLANGWHRLPSRMGRGGWRLRRWSHARSGRLVGEVCHEDVIQLMPAPVVVLAGGTGKVQPVEQAMDVGATTRSTSRSTRWGAARAAW
jgi:hypothetical protein